tara:strand:+ start:7120 stop:7341 length:222 start_codon:yes stop_codon:yes gene_type:complete
MKTKEVNLKVRPLELDMLIDVIRFTTNLKNTVPEGSMKEMDDEPIFNRPGEALLAYLEEMKQKVETQPSYTIQ